MKTRLTYIMAALLTAAAMAVSCKKDAPAAGETAVPLSVESQSGPVKAVVTVAPGKAAIDRHMILTLRVTHPSDVRVELPGLDDRVEGFVAGHSFDRTVADEQGNTVVEKVSRLAPTSGPEYRIRPVPIVYYTSTAAGLKKNWFPTTPIRLELEVPQTATTGVTDQIRPVWIRPTAKEITIYAVIVAALILLMAAAISFIRRALRFVRLMRMSPRDRALEELRMLLEKNLVTRNMVKEFYLQLTMIVRMFIERGYHIRAPEQTTEEFLASAGRDSRFTPNVLNKLRTFLQSADLVKFAGFKPDREAIDAAVAGARNFIRIESSENPETGRKQEVQDA